jgi:K+-sensing histidine kinase KdpD
MGMSSRRDLRPSLTSFSVRFGSPLAITFTAIAVAIRWFLDPWLGDAHPLVTLYGAVAASVWLAGHGPGTLAAISGYLASDYLFIEPRGTLGFANAMSFVTALAYFATSALIIALGNAVRTARGPVAATNCFRPPSAALAMPLSRPT